MTTGCWFMKKNLKEDGIVVQYRTDDFKDPHPNTYRVTLENSTETHSLIAISTGGGMIEIVDIDGAEVSITGRPLCDPGLLRWGCKAASSKNSTPSVPLRSLKIGSQGCFVEILSHQAPREEDITAMAAMAGVQYVRCIQPVLPIHRPRHLKVPFQTPTEMAAFARKKEFSLDALALLYESQRGDITQETVLQRMVEIVQVLRSSIKIGLEGTDYKDRILGYQSGAYLEESKRGAPHGSWRDGPGHSLRGQPHGS